MLLEHILIAYNDIQKWFVYIERINWDSFIETASGWLSGWHIHLSCGRSQVHAPARSYQTPS